MGQLLLMARNKALTLLLKLYRRTPIFRPRHLPGRNRTQNDDTINISLPCRISERNSVLGGFVRLDLLGESTLEADSDVEFVEDEDVFLDLQSLRRQGNFEMAVMAGGQLEVDSEEDGEYDDYDYDDYDCDGYVQFVEYEGCEGEGDRLRDRDRIAEGLGQVRAATSKGLQPDSGSRGSPTKRATSPSKQVRD